MFEQTYTRFLDLQKAEQQLREAVKQASLDRVRGEIASMRTKDDLDQITPLIWKELIALGVPFIRCGVFIMDDVKRVVHSYLSTPDGKSLSAFEMSFDDEGIAKAIAEYWKREKIYKEFWDKNQFLDFMNTLIDRAKLINLNLIRAQLHHPSRCTSILFLLNRGCFTWVILLLLNRKN